MVHALELLKIKFPVLSVLEIIQGELNIGGHLVAVHRVDEEPHLLLRDEALFISIEDKKAKFEHLRDLEEAVGGDGGHKFPEVDGLGICCFYQVEQAVTKNGSGYEYYFIIKIGDGDDGSTFFIVLLEHVPQDSYVFFLRAACLSDAPRNGSNSKKKPLSWK